MSETEDERHHRLEPYIIQYERDLAKQTKNGPHELDEQHRDVNRQVYRILLQKGLIPIPDCNKTNDADLIMRFLIARRYHVDQVVANIERYVEWRQRERIDEVLWEQLDPELEFVGPIYRGFSSEGNYPVGWQQPDPAKISALLDNDKFTVEAIMRRNWQALETSRRIMLAEGTDRMVQVLDLSEMGVSILGRPQVLSLLKEISQRTQGLYPELLRTMYITNGGFLFSTVWAAVRPMLDERVQKKVQDCGGGEDVAEILKEWIPMDQIPTSYGGHAVDNVPLHTCLAECVDGKVPPGTPPMRPEGYRGDLPPPPGAMMAADSSSYFDDEGGPLEGDDGEPSAEAAEDGADLESCDSGDLEQPDVLVSSPSRRGHGGGNDDDDDENDSQQQQNQPQNGSASPGVVIQLHRPRRKSVSLSTSMVLPAPAPASSAANAALFSAMFKQPPRCVHLFVRLKSQSTFLEPRITSRIDTGGAASSSQGSQAMQQHERITTMEKSGHFYVIGSKILQPQKSTPTASKARMHRSVTSSSSDTGPASPASPFASSSPRAGVPAAVAAAPHKCTAEFHVESGAGGVAFRKHILVLDANRRVHFILQRAAMHNEVRVLRPDSDLLPEVEEVKLSFRGPAERKLIARIIVPAAVASADASSSSSSPSSSSQSSYSSSVGRGGWIAIRDDGTKKEEESSFMPAQDVVMARCAEFPISAKNQSIATELFQVPKDKHRFERGTLQRRNGDVAFHRHVAFWHDFLSAPVQVLVALTAAVDALFLDP